MADSNIKLVPVEGKVISSKESKMGTFEHDLKIQINKMVKDCQEHNIPIFIVYYSETEKYSFQGVMPEEIGTASVSNQYGKFDEFFKTCIGINKEENFKSSIHKIPD